MVREVSMQAIVEQFRQILECQFALFIPGCPDTGLRHPLLDFLPTNTLPMMHFSASPSEKRHLAGIWMEEQIRALCDLAVQSGRMETLNGCGALVDRWHLKSIAAVPLELPAGALGAFLLADELPERFGAGEEHLVSVCLSMYMDHLDSVLREYARISLADDGREARSYSEPGQLSKDEFVSMVGHELRSPLSIIKGYAALLQIYGGTNGQQGPALTPDRQRHYLDAIMEQTSLLEVLVNDLLDISCIQRGKLALRPRVVDVGALCQQIMQFGQMRADQQVPGKYQLECVLSPQFSPLWVDADRLRQVLMNVVENAIKFSPNGGLIKLETSLLETCEERDCISSGQQTPARICFIVRDQGIGIPFSHSARLFQPFERLEQPGVMQVGGMGLGLYITRQLVEAMGGSVDLQGREGNGTTVTIILPAIDPGEVIAPEAVAQVSCLPVG